MFAKLILFGLCCLLAGLPGLNLAPARAADPPAAEAATPALSLTEALERTFAQNPELRAAAEELRAAAAEAGLAGRRPNPELSLAWENFAGEGSYRGSDAAELTIAVSQPVELGGKRRLRWEAAELGRQLAANGELLTRAELDAETRRRFIAVLAAQDGLDLAREQAQLAAAALAAAEERIRAGKAPAMERLRLEGEAGLAGLAVGRAEGELLNARQALAASWGAAQPDFARAAGDLALLPALPDPESLETALERSADTRNRQLATQLLGKEYERARAARLPDPTVTVGWRHFRESDEQAALLGLAVPLPFFNQGQEALAAAGSRHHAARAHELGAHQEARTALHRAWQTLAANRAAAEIYARQIVPAAAEGFATAEFGYRAGKFGLLELLDARRALFEARQQLLATRTDCQLAAIELQRLLHSP